MAPHKNGEGTLTIHEQIDCVNGMSSGQADAKANTSGEAQKSDEDLRIQRFEKGTSVMERQLSQAMRRNNTDFDFRNYAFGADMMIYHWDEFIEHYGEQHGEEGFRRCHKVLRPSGNFNTPDVLIGEYNKIIEIESLLSSLEGQLERTT